MQGCVTTMPSCTGGGSVPALASNRRNFNKIKIDNQTAVMATLPVSQPAKARGDDNITEYWQLHAVALGPTVSNGTIFSLKSV